jgi:hypothetical protein
MVATVIGLTVLSIGALAYASHRRMRALESSIGALRSDVRTSAEALEDNQRKLDARQDRLQKMVTDRGWQDSMLLTRFDWRDPKDRG